MQGSLDAIQAWTELWGFKLSAAKTTAVLFTDRKITKFDTPLTLCGKPLELESSVKFLGMYFDSRLNWGKHASYIRTKANKRLNLMRCVSGASWGLARQR